MTIEGYDSTLIDLSEDFEGRLSDVVFSDLGNWIDKQLERGVGLFALVGVLELQKQVLLLSMVDLDEEL